MRHSYWSCSNFADLGLTLSGNHPGVQLWLCLFGFGVSAEFYDERHDVGVFQ